MGENVSQKKSRGRKILIAAAAAVLLALICMAGLVYVRIYRNAAPSNKSLLFNYTSTGAAVSAGDETAELSVDDFIEAFRDISSGKNSYKSVFDNKTFAFLKEMHDLYGARVTCYCYFSQDGFSLDDCTDAFHDELAANSDWLKFGFHAGNQWSDYTCAGSEEQLVSDYVKTVKALERIAGADSIDTVVRLSMFASTREGAAALASLPADEYPVTGLLTADDSRTSYGLDAEKNAFVFSHGELYDEETGITYYSTDLRAEYIVLPGLKLREIKKAAGDGGCEDVRLFSHEWKLDEFTVRYNIKRILKGTKH